MLQRPKPTDSEADLLKEQQHFLTSGVPAAASVVRRPDKRRGEGGGRGLGEEAKERSQKDMVTIEELPDQLPLLTPAPPKKSRFKAGCVSFEDEDAAERLDRHDTHLTAVLSRIIERDTSSAPISLPALTGLAFPRVQRRLDASTQLPSAGGKRSIFARQIAAQRLQQTETCPAQQHVQSRVVAPGGSGPRLVSGEGLLGLRGQDTCGETLRIHRENQAKLQSMSGSEILQEQKKLLSQLDPGLVEFIRSHRTHKVPSTSSECVVDNNREPPSLQGVSKEVTCSTAAVLPHRPQEVDMVQEEEKKEEGPSLSTLTEDFLPVKPQKDWIHMDKLEPEKLQWMMDLPVTRGKGTKQAMQARFDFAGTLILPTEDLPTHLGLHHHGEEPERAGYSLQELFMLSRSHMAQQRSLALCTLASILSKGRAGQYRLVMTGSVVSTLLDAGLLFLLRFALDDGVEAVMSAAVHALNALLVCEEDEECLDSTFAWFGGLASFPLLPSPPADDNEEDERLHESLRETAQEKEEKKSDHDVASQDVVKGLLRMKLLPRLRYILEVVRPSPRAVQEILEILTRVARHSSSSAAQVLDCPRLIETLMAEFLPASWVASSSLSPSTVYGLPLPAALKLLRVVASSGRHACARLLNSVGVKERLSCLLSAEPCKLLLESGEALRLHTEACRLVTVAVGYGQACQLYLDLYPALMKDMQSIHYVLSNPDPLLALQVQRLQALLALFTQITHTAGCQQELQAAMLSSQEEQCPPPPPVSWNHVSGLHASLLSHLKSFIVNLDDPVQRDTSLALIPAYLVYLNAYYHQLSRQSCFKPVETLEDLEFLMSAVLLPLMHHAAVQNLMQNLKSSSVVCSALYVGPDIPLSLPGLACSGWRTSPGLAASSSPVPLLIGLVLLLETITGIHKGLRSKFTCLLVSEPVIGYLQSCSIAKPDMSHPRAWLLRHEHHLLYLLLRLAHRLVPLEPEVARHAGLYHQVALVLVPWLLPGSEYFAHELLSVIIFSKDFILEGQSGGPEALELGELKLHGELDTQVTPSLQTVGSLLREACVELPSIRGCFLTHLAHLEQSVLASRDTLLGRTPWITSHFLPELSGPAVPSDWPFVPLISLYECTAMRESDGLAVEQLPPGALQAVTHCLQWLLLLEVWREEALQVVPPVAKLARLSCVFLCSSDLFLERPVQRLTWALFRLMTRGPRLDSLDLNAPPPGLASFEDLYSALLTQYEAVSFGDPLFGCWLLLPLQRKYSATMRLAVFGEHVGMLRSLSVTPGQLSIPLECFTFPPEDSLPLLQLYFRSLVTGVLKLCWCPVLYIVALAHVNSFIFSQDAAAQEVEEARLEMLRKIYHLTDQVLRKHLLFFHQPQQHSTLGFDMYEELSIIRTKRLQSVIQPKDDSKK